MGVNSKRKGSAWERECSVILSKWWTDGERDDCVWRTSGSGSRATTRRKKGVATYNQDGDLCANDPIIQPFFDTFLVECKIGYTSGSPVSNVGVLYMVDNQAGKDTQSMLVRWFNKAWDEAAEVGKVPIILLKRTRKAPVIIYSRWLHVALSGYIGEFPGTLIVVRGAAYQDFYILRLSAFLEWCEKDIVLSVCESLAKER